MKKICIEKFRNFAIGQVGVNFAISVLIFCVCVFDTFASNDFANELSLIGSNCEKCEILTL